MGCASLSQACLSINRDFKPELGGKSTQERLSSTGPNTQPSSTQATDRETGTTTTMTSPSSETSSQLTTPSSSSSSTSTETFDPGAGTGLPPGAIWVPVRVWNPSAIDTAYKGVVTSFTFDHLSFVARGARLDGKDVRLYSVRGALTTELHLALDPESSWNSSNVKIWFRTDGPVNALASQSDIYFLVFEARDNEPLQDPQQVFAFYEDFNQESLDRQRWDLKTKMEGPGVVQNVKIENGELALAAGPSGPGFVSSAGVRSRVSMSSSGLAVEARLRFETHTERDDCTLENLVGFWSHGQDRARAIWQRGGAVWHILNDQDNGAVSRQYLSSRPETGDARRYLLRWPSPTLRAYADTLQQGEVTLRSTSFTRPSDGALNLGFDAIANGLECNDRESKLWIDWVFARPIFSDFELNASFEAALEFSKPASN